MVRLKVYKTYFRANGHIIFWLIVAILFIGARGLQVLENFWLKMWSEAQISDYGHNETLLPEVTNSFIWKPKFILDNNIYGEINSKYTYSEVNESHSVDYYLNIYIAITLASVLLGVLRFLWCYHGSLKASRKLYQRLLHQVIRAPLRFFDTTPVGRILNRFSNDFETVDSKLISNVINNLLFVQIKFNLNFD